MTRRRRQAFKAAIQIDGTALPVSIRFDLLEGHYYSMSRRNIRMRLPFWAGESDIRRHLAQCEDWVATEFLRRPLLRESFLKVPYKSGDVLEVGTRRYLLDIVVEERATHTARLIGNTISVQLSNRSDDAHRAKSVRTLLSRVVAGDYYPEVARRVYDWNDRTFRRPVKNIYLKYNHSNWGSCSRDGNVNLSTRLLFAPVEVQDYVILHELAHLVELNHSDRFWSLVERFMPDYQDRERWLKTNRSRCDF